MMGEARRRHFCGKLIDFCFRKAYRVGWPLAQRFRRFYTQDGVCIAVWAGYRLLVVRHSYKPGLSILGGGVKRGEDPLLSAVRELREEVAIDVDPANVRLINKVKLVQDHGINYFYEIRLQTQPGVTIDRREIIYAEVLLPAEIMLAGCDHYFAAYITTANILVSGIETVDTAAKTR